jgi:AcrR family transcriptional regulator
MNNKFAKKRDLIISEAKILFHTFGFEKTTMDDVAAKVGIKKNTLYYYFSDKEALFAEVLKEDVEEIISAVTAFSGKAKTAENKVLNFLKAISEAIFERARLYTLRPKILLEFMIVLEHSSNPQVDRLLMLLENILREGVKKKEFIKHNCSEFSLILLEFIMSYNFTHLSKAVYEGVTFEELKSASCCETILNKGITHMLKGIKHQKQ